MKKISVFGLKPHFLRYGSNFSLHSVYLKEHVYSLDQHWSYQMLNIICISVGMCALIRSTLVI